MNKNGPFQTVFLLRTMIYERQHDGKVTGIPVEENSEVFTVMGKDLQECKDKTEELLNKIREINKQGDTE